MPRQRSTGSYFIFVNKLLQVLLFANSYVHIIIARTSIILSLSLPRCDQLVWFNYETLPLLFVLFILFVFRWIDLTIEIKSLMAINLF